MTVPTLYLLVGLPGAGKTTEALRLAETERAVRLSPDEWMLPLFGESDPNGLRDVMEGRLVWVGLQALRGGANVVIDFGLWGRDERTALRFLAGSAGARAVVIFPDPPESERRRRIDRRYAAAPDSTFAMSEAEIAEHLAAFQRPDASELADGPLDPVPARFSSWADWAADRWPSLRPGTR
ncbi:MAG TPA: ATP-binding protein [Microlunatus sp.]